MLICDGKPAAGIVVKLQDHDTFDPNDTLGCTTTEEDGSYEMQGFTDEKTSIDLRLKIYTDCHDSSLWGLIKDVPCQRRITLDLPNEAINSGQNVTNWFVAGVINLDIKQTGEGRSCAITNRC
uniref:Uncharacterized protein n=1 Tax=Plectus sambesii TaxID=2011161 RepID=A0A914VTX9_9BILA